MSYSYWHADTAQPECEGCYRPFTFTIRRHHCRDCGGLFCHQCSSRAVIMFHRASPKTKVRICKFCVPYVDARLTTKIEEERAASLERPGIYNETFVKNFASTKRVLLAPEDAVHAGYRLNRILQRSEALFLPSNDLFIRKDETNLNGEDDADNDNDDDAPPKTVRTVLMEGDVRKSLQTSSPATAIKDPQMNFPAACAQDCMSILFDSSIVAATIPSFQRLKDCLTSAHHVAINAEPQSPPAVVQPMFYY
jgi:hypothetical protein